jgi:hypothetical protein
MNDISFLSVYAYLQYIACNLCHYDDMEIHFSDHALFKMGQRKIPISLVRKVVLSPDIRKLGSYPREEWHRRFGVRYLKVVVVREPEQIVVVTAHWVKKVSL